MATATHGSFTAQEQAINATKKLCEALNLNEVKSTDLKYLTIALAEVASKEASLNSDFAEKIRLKYLELLPKKTEKTAKVTIKVTAKKIGLTNLIPIKQVDIAKIFNPHTPPDPYLLFEVYGTEQLPLALESFSLTLLRKVALDVEYKFPGTKAKNKNQKDSIVEYIVSQVVK